MQKFTQDHNLVEKITTAVIIAGVLGYWAYILLGSN
jgi:hypothetical protein